MSIIIYTRNDCVQCHATKRAMESRGVAFEMVNIDQQPEAADTLRAQGFRQLPVVVAGETSWSGFRPDMINRIAAQAIGLNLTKYKLMAFVTSAALAGAAGALFGLNYSSLQATKFNFNLSILILVFVVLGGLGNIWGSLVAAAALTILPEALRQFSDFRMLIYAIVLICVMLATNNPQAKAFFQKLLPHRRAVAEKEEN